LESSYETNNILELFRTEQASVESELFSRIANLEAQLAHGLPPQLNPGEYANLVREHLDGAVSIDHYRKSIIPKLMKYT
jgi:hypothetical protein